MMMRDLKAHLEELPLSTMEVQIYELSAYVISPDFIGQGMTERHDLIWGHLLARLNYDELYDFTNVYAYTPDEMAALQRGERPVMQVGEQPSLQEQVEALERRMAPVLDRLRGRGPEAA